DCVLADLFCAPGAPDAGCYRAYPIGLVQPAHVTVHPDGRVWFTEYNFGIGAALGRLDPDASDPGQAVERYPLSPPPFSPDAPIPFALFPYITVATWDVEVDRDGSILASEYASDRIARFRPQFMNNTGTCQSISAPPGDVRP